MGKKRQGVPRMHAERSAPNGAEMQLPILQIPLEGVPLGVKDEDGQKLLVIGPVAMVFGLPLDTEAAKQLAGVLAGGIDIPSGAVVDRIVRAR